METEHSDMTQKTFIEESAESAIAMKSDDLGGERGVSISQSGIISKANPDFDQKHTQKANLPVGETKNHDEKIRAKAGMPAKTEPDKSSLERLDERIRAKTANYPEENVKSEPNEQFGRNVSEENVKSERASVSETNEQFGRNGNDDQSGNLPSGVTTGIDLGLSPRANSLVESSRQLAGGDGLAVATAVGRDDNAFGRRTSVPLAVEYDPDAKVAPHRKRRFRIFTIAFAVVIIIVVVILTLFATDRLGGSEPNNRFVSSEPSEAPSAPPTTSRDTEGIYDIIASELDRDPSELKDESSDDPAARAALWIVNQDRQELDRSDVDLFARFALATLYFSTNGRDWTSCSADFTDDQQNCTKFEPDLKKNLTGSTYLSSKHHCDWYGIECSSQNTLKEIFLASLNLTGKIPSEIALIDTLQHLKLTDNSLTGTIPSELGSMPFINDIELNSNSLSGGIPDSILANDQLSRLNVGSNKLSGMISSKIGGLTNVGGLFLFDNSFSGQIPSEIGNLRRLENLRLGKNPLSGTIPSQLGELTNLKELYIENANLSGPIPETFGNLQKMANLRLNGNKITGTIDAIYDLKQLSIFYGFDNRLTGTIDTRIGELTNMKLLILRRNRLNDTVPEEIAIPGLIELWLHYNDFTGTITDKLCDLNLNRVFADCLETPNKEAAVKCDCCNRCCTKANEDQEEECKAV